MKLGFRPRMGVMLGVVVLGWPQSYVFAQGGAAPSQTTQTMQAATTTPAAGAAKPASAKKTVRRRRVTPRNGEVQRIPIEQAPPSPAGPDQTAAQRAADQRLLQQQQAQSARAARVTDQQVDKAQQRIDKVQSEQRIQDAPGPSQTGLVPAAGPPVLPASRPATIEDAPGPSQTLAPANQPEVSVPEQPAQPAQPAQPPPPPVA